METIYNKGNARVFLFTLLFFTAVYFLLKLVNYNQYSSILNFLSVFIVISSSITGYLVSKAYIKNV